MTACRSRSTLTVEATVQRARSRQAIWHTIVLDTIISCDTLTSQARVRERRGWIRLRCWKRAMHHLNNEMIQEDRML